MPTRPLATTAALAGLIALAAPVAFAQDRPPATALPLSQIVTNLEAQGAQAFAEIDWDDDGYWEVEYWNAEGNRVEIRIDPVSGQPRSR
jgi:hypothetical protein